MQTGMDILRGHIVAGDSKALYIQRKNKIYKRSQDNERYIFSISMPLWKRILIEIRLCQRLLRTDIRSAIICEGKLFYALSGCLYSYDFCNRKNKRELVFRSGMRAPLSFTSICGIKGFEDQICFGEYFSNNNREEVNIWSNRGGEWNVVYSFPKGSIRHIHGIVGDRYRNCVYVLTGDSDAESAIWKAENGFESVEKLISGDQQSRCCVLQPRKNCLVYATDSEYEQNKIYVVDFKGNGRTERIPIYDLEGSVIYGYVLEEDKMYISTTVEPNKGGIRTNSVNVYELDADRRLHEITADIKDAFDSTYFQYGSADILKIDGKLFISFTATKNYDGKTIMIRR